MNRHRFFADDGSGVRRGARDFHGQDEFPGFVFFKQVVRSGREGNLLDRPVWVSTFTVATSVQPASTSRSTEKPKQGTWATFVRRLQTMKHYGGRLDRGNPSNPAENMRSSTLGRVSNSTSPPRPHELLSSGI